MEDSTKDDFNYRNPTLKNIEALVSFLPFFENPESHFFADGNGTYDYSDEVKKLVDTFHKQGFVFSFDYPSWLRAEGSIYLQNPDLIYSANLLNIQKLVTTIMRMNRFSSSPPGDKDFLRRKIQDGTILKILKRLDQIRSTMT